MPEAGTDELGEVLRLVETLRERLLLLSHELDNLEFITREGVDQVKTLKQVLFKTER